MKISRKNIENWRSWKMRVFWGGHFEFLSRPFWIFFLLHLIEKCSPFIWGIIFFCTMDGFSRILEKKLSELLCTRLYVCEINFSIYIFRADLIYIPLAATSSSRCRCHHGSREWVVRIGTKADVSVQKNHWKTNDAVKQRFEKDWNRRWCWRISYSSA